MSRRSMLLNSFPAIESAQMLRQSAIDLHSKVYEDGKSGAVPSLPKFVTVSWPRKPKRLSVGGGGGEVLGAYILLIQSVHS